MSLSNGLAAARGGPIRLDFRRCEASMSNSPCSVSCFVVEPWLDPERRDDLLPSALNMLKRAMSGKALKEDSCMQGSYGSEMMKLRDGMTLRSSGGLNFRKIWPGDRGNCACEQKYLMDSCREWRHFGTVLQPRRITRRYHQRISVCPTFVVLR